MGTEKFTPGPWEAIDGKNLVWVDGPAHNVCDLYHTHIGEDGNEFVSKHNAVANARLIAAAPDLYEALKVIRSLNAKASESGYTDSAALEELFTANALASAALAKARGGGME